MRKLWLLIIGLLAAMGVAAEPSCQVDPSKGPYYRLELTVPATFCKGGSARADPSCKQFPKKGLIQLHGLWPNYQQGYPEGTCSPNECLGAQGSYCNYPNPAGLSESEGWKNLNGYMAGTEKCLERHEWVKHGVCTKMQAPQYFEWSLNKAKAMSGALAPLAGQRITRYRFNQVIAEKLPEVNGGVRLQCKGHYLSSLSIYYAWGETPQAMIPTKGGQNSFGNCSNNFVIPSRP